MMTALLILGALVPQDSLAVERCGELELNHIWSTQEDPWGGQPQVSIASYWLGWRAGAGDDEPVVDWWRRYADERVWLSDGRAYMLICDTQRLVLVIAKRWRQHWTPHDVELEQRRELEERFGADHRKYRRGLAGSKPQ